MFALVDGPTGEFTRPGVATGSFQDCDYFVICLYGAFVGRHSLATERRKSPVGLAALIAPVAVFFAAGADMKPAPPPEADPVVAEGPPCCVELVAAPPNLFTPAPSVGPSTAAPDSAQLVSASRYRVVPIPELLPVGRAPERGLQVKTILASRAISVAFPEIQSIGGVRPDALRWHPAGLALDVMIPNAGTPEGIALGNEIVAFVIKNAVRFGMQDAIWRGVYYTPNGPRGSGNGHYDHVHITTTGGGYPTGGEAYIR